MDGDGLDDLAVGAPGAGEEDERPGAVYLLTSAGPRQGALGDVAHAVLGGAADDDWAGDAVAGADLDHDGHTDLVVGAPRAGGAVWGAVYVAYGPLSGQISLGGQQMTLARIDGDVAHDGFGSTLAVVDTNGDGPLDVVAGAPGHDGIDQDELGGVYLFLGGTM